jgi:hypothetical protein
MHQYTRNTNMTPSIFLNQFKEMTNILSKTTHFIINNKLWKGFLKQKLALTFLVIAGILVAWSTLKYVKTNTEALYAVNFQKSEIATSALNNAMSIESLFAGSHKYVLLILIQMLVVYFSNKTIEILSDMKINMSLGEMIQSQWRVLQLTIRNWVIEIIIGIIISIFVGIFAPDFMEDVLKWLVQCYFVGYFFIDNYNNTFGLKISESAKIVRKYAGATLMIGLVANLLFFLPVIGAIIASFICSVAATWYMHTGPDAQLAKNAFPE